MKLEELEKEMEMAVASKLVPRPKLVKGDKPSGGPAGVEAKVLEGEVLSPEGDEESYDELGYACNLIYRLRSLLAYLGDAKLVTTVQSPDRIEIGNHIDEIDDFLDWVEEDGEEDEELLYCSQCEYQILNTATDTRQCPDCKNHPDLLTQEELEEDLADPAFEAKPPMDDPAYVQEAEEFLNSDIPNLNKGNCKNLVHSTCVMSVSDSRLWCTPCREWYSTFYYEGRTDGVLVNDGEMSAREYELMSNIVSNLGLDI